MKYILKFESFKNNKKGDLTKRAASLNEELAENLNKFNEADKKVVVLKIDAASVQENTQKFSRAARKVRDKEKSSYNKIYIILAILVVIGITYLLFTILTSED